MDKTWFGNDITRCITHKYPQRYFNLHCRRLGCLSLLMQELDCRWQDDKFDVRRLLRKNEKKCPLQYWYDSYWSPWNKQLRVEWWGKTTEYSLNKSIKWECVKVISMSEASLEQTKRLFEKGCYNGLFFCSLKQINDYLSFAIEGKYQYIITIWHKSDPTPLCNNNIWMMLNGAIYIKQSGKRIKGTIQLKVLCINLV